jgi:hypothetical protein
LLGLYACLELTAIGLLSEKKSFLASALPSFSIDNTLAHPSQIFFQRIIKTAWRKILLEENAYLISDLVPLITQTSEKLLLEVCREESEKISHVTKEKISRYLADSSKCEKALIYLEGESESILLRAEASDILIP